MVRRLEGAIYVYFGHPTDTRWYRYPRFWKVMKLALVSGPKSPGCGSVTFDKYDDLVAAVPAYNGGDGALYLYTGIMVE